MIDLGREPDYRGRWEQEGPYDERSDFILYILERRPSFEHEHAEIIEGVIKDRLGLDGFSGDIDNETCTIYFQKQYIKPGIGSGIVRYDGIIDENGNISGTFRIGEPSATYRGKFTMSPVKQIVESTA